MNFPSSKELLTAALSEVKEDPDVVNAGLNIIAAFASLVVEDRKAATFYLSDFTPSELTKIHRAASELARLCELLT
jgi:hypothetical protein